MTISESKAVFKKSISFCQVFWGKRWKQEKRKQIVETEGRSTLQNCHLLESNIQEWSFKEFLPFAVTNIPFKGTMPDTIGVKAKARRLWGLREQGVRSDSLGVKMPEESSGLEDFRVKKVLKYGIFS